MKNKKIKYKIEYLSTNHKGTTNEYISIDNVEFDDPKDALAFWESLNPDIRVTERIDIPIDEEDEVETKVL